MFTGLIEAVGRVVELTERRGATRLGVFVGPLATELTPGASVAVDGVCLTVARRGRGHVWADLMGETLARTTLGDLKAGDRVNLERALRIGDRLGGHLVQGHVDARAPVRRVVRQGRDLRLVVGLAPGLRRYVAAQGSVALDGVSLTVARVSPTAFEVALVPHTLERTTLGELAPGDRVNVEVDLLARYLETMLVRPRPAGRTRRTSGHKSARS